LLSALVSCSFTAVFTAESAAAGRSTASEPGRSTAALFSPWTVVVGLPRDSSSPPDMINQLQHPAQQQQRLVDISL